MKKIYLITALLLILNSLAVARIAAALVTYRLSHALPKAVNLTPSAIRPAHAEGLSAFAPIVEKGLFGRAAQGKLTPLAAATPAAKGNSPTSAQGDLVLVGTVRGSFRETFALIRRTMPPEERVFRLGDQVFDRGPLVSVQKESVEILSGGKRVKFMTPLATPSETPSPPSPSSQAPAVTGGAGSFVIDQRVLNAALDNIGQAMTDARLLPSVKDGKVEGFRVSEVKPSGVFAMVGIKNGDVLHKINDLPVDSPERAIQSLASLKGQNRIKLDLVRDGKPATFSYDIR
ncbi:type II secretion system protein N [Geobacter sp.]|uniref:type II secretion system protein N n=1 Tax=Geobacter sp. TaxID=46610 RepID=UPI0027B9716A|nr:type II secretion system protein N [Geobacter sp.]